MENMPQVSQEQFITSKIIQGLQTENGQLRVRVYELVAKEELYVMSIQSKDERIKELEEELKNARPTDTCEEKSIAVKE